MAIQNTTAGGYYGKLGSTIGQRWKNKRTVKAYVKPYNPRTEKQQLNRGQFGEDVQLSHIAQALNWKTPLFTTTERTEWSLRMSSASSRRKQGYTQLNLIPIAPISTTTNYTINKVSFEQGSSENEINLCCSGTLPTTNQTVSVLIAKYDTTGALLSYNIYNSTLDVTNNNIIPITLEHGETIEVGDQCLIVGNSQTLTVDEIILSQQIELTQGVKNLTISDYTLVVNGSEVTLSLLINETFDFTTYVTAPTVQITFNANFTTYTKFFTPTSIIKSEQYLVLTGIPDSTLEYYYFNQQTTNFITNTVFEFSSDTQDYAIQNQTIYASSVIEPEVISIPTSTTVSNTYNIYIPLQLHYTENIQEITSTTTSIQGTNNNSGIHTYKSNYSVQLIKDTSDLAIVDIEAYGKILAVYNCSIDAFTLTQEINNVTYTFTASNNITFVNGINEETISSFSIAHATNPQTYNIGVSSVALDDSIESSNNPSYSFSNISFSEIPYNHKIILESYEGESLYYAVDRATYGGISGYMTFTQVLSIIQSGSIHYYQINPNFVADITTESAVTEVNNSLTSGATVQMVAEPQDINNPSIKIVNNTTGEILLKYTFNKVVTSNFFMRFSAN